VGYDADDRDDRAGNRCGGRGDGRVNVSSEEVMV